MVELRDVKMQFDEKKVLDGCSLSVEPEERLVIMGQSGSGKSTILRLILGILQPDAGSIRTRTCVEASQHEAESLKPRSV